MDLPIYKLVINPEDEETGVDFVALVNMPAIERNFQAFKSHKFTTNDEKRIVTGPLMIPNQLIYRRDNQIGEYYVTYDEEMVVKIAEKFMKKQYINNVNEEHKTPVKDVFMFETFFKDDSRGISAPKGFEDVPNMTWFGSYKIYNDEVWSQVKDGTFKGFSVEGEFLHSPFRASKQTPSNEPNDKWSIEVLLIDEILSML
jgi:hypothetical protein